MSTQERIKQEAELMPEKLGWSNDGTSEGADIKKSYIAGALSERNKVIEEIQTNLMQNWHKKSADEIYDLLESLKV